MAKNTKTASRQEDRRHTVPCTIEEATAELAKRSEKGIIPREPRKGFYRMYTQNARSAMQGGGLE